ncbi:4a-hydroxytetrahydrobiopterin dehydratase [Nocardioides sp.]|uniref:4a-hydroxytetrahydrobiopterin dehydratase n=1 Tax=Nocardioides sp. TaxID=35761 RepID=UPI002ED56E9C
MGDKDRLTGDQITALGLADWRPVLASLRGRFKTGGFTTSLELARRITDVAEEMNHHPDLDLRWPHVDIDLTSHDVGGMTQRDVELARRISEIAADMGLEAQPGARQEVELSLDTWDAEEIKPFWAALLAADIGPDLVEPTGQLPSLWFQDTDRHETPRQRFHLDVWVTPDEAAGRIEAAVAAGGTVVDDSNAPSFTVIADAQGNRACVCSNAARGGG